MTPPRVIVTRPAQEAGRWVRDLRAHGLVAQALPLIAILPVTDAPARQALQQARARLGHGRGAYQAVMFVSGNAARYFLAADAPAERISIEQIAPQTRAWATGAGTARALAECGWPRARIDAPDDSAQADSEALWVRVQTQIQPGARVLIVRGGDAAGHPAGRAWLADQLTAAGAQVDTVVAYRRAPPVWSAAEQALARTAARDGSVWLISSSEAAAHWGALMSKLLPTPLPESTNDKAPGARAVVTHPRIERAARAAGFGVVFTASPAPPALMAAIRSIKSFA